MRKKLLRAALLLVVVALVLSSSFVLFSGHVAERPWIQKTVGNLYLIAATITIFVVSSFTWLKPSSWWGKMARILFAVLFGGWTVTLIIAFLLPEGGHPSGGGLAIIGMGALTLIICPIALLALGVALFKGEKRVFAIWGLTLLLWISVVLGLLPTVANIARGALGAHTTPAPP